MPTKIDPRFSAYLEDLHQSGLLKLNTTKNYAEYAKWFGRYGDGTLTVQNLQDRSFVQKFVDKVAAGFDANPSKQRKHTFNERRKSDARTVLSHYLAFLRSEEVAEKQEQLENEGSYDVSNKAEGKEKVLRSIALRLGQPQFRQSLLEAYGGRCAVTGTPIEGILEAAHITPYNGPSTNHVRNGILLRSDIHALFDLGLLSVDPQTLTVYCSKSIRGVSAYSGLHKNPVSVPQDASKRPDSALLLKHFQNRVE